MSGSSQTRKNKVSQQETQPEDQSLLLPPDEIANPFMASTVSDTVSENNEAVAAEEQEVAVPTVGEAGEAVEVEEVGEAGEVEEAETGGPTLQEEIALWKYCAPDELYMLIKEDPARYLPAFEKDRELSQKHGCLVTRENGKLRIKYRIYPEDRWNECGFFEEFDDQVIFQEFSESVQRSLNQPRNRRDPKSMSRKDYLKKVEADNSGSDRAHIAAELDQPPKAHVVAGNSDTENLDRAKMLELKAKQMKQDDLIHERAMPRDRDLQKDVQKETSRPRKSKKERNVDDISDDAIQYRISEKQSLKAPKAEQSGSNLGLLLDAYIQQLLERMNLVVRGWIASSKKNTNSYANKGLEQLISNLTSIEQKVPQNLYQDYKNLISSLASAPTNDFYNFMVDQKQHFLPKHLEPIYDNFLAKIVTNNSLYLGQEFTHERICRLLALSEVDVQLLDEHNVDLRELWNNSITHQK